MNHYEIYNAIVGDTSAKNPHRSNYKLQSLLRDYSTLPTEVAIENLTFALAFFQQKQVELSSIKEKENSFCCQVINRHKLLNCPEDN